jgi:hypothetical protein
MQDTLTASSINNANGSWQQRQSGNFVAGGYNTQETLDSGFHGTAAGTIAQPHSNVMMSFFGGGLVICHVLHSK